MKLSTLFILFLAGILSLPRAYSQANASINILTQNSGLVSLGGTVFLEVTLNNTGPTSSIGLYKVKTQISVPSAIASIPTTGHQLPPGWTITSNIGTAINLSNGTDIIPVNESRTILIAMHGDAVGGPSTVSGQLSFSNGNPPGTGPGTLPGDNTADNFSASTIEVTNATPVTLTDFNASVINCQPVLNWVTENEINLDRFEIESGNPDNATWSYVGAAAAKGYTSTKSKYNFIDRNLTVTAGRILYRLKLIDKDGRYKYSAVLPVFINCKATQVHAYPNPVKNGRLYVSLTGAARYSEATLLSLSGQVILKHNINNGTNYLNVSNIAAGLYELNIKDPSGLVTKVKVFIQN